MNKKIIKLLLVIIAILSVGNCYVQDVSTSKKVLITNVNKITSNSYVALTQEIEKKEVDDSSNKIRKEDSNKKSDITSAVPKKEKQLIKR